MKRCFTVVLVCTCITGGSCLQCFSCSAVSDPCILKDSTCLSTTTNCQTVSSHTVTTSDENKNKTISRIDQRCEMPSQDFSLSTGRVFISQSIHLCGSDRCNKQTEAEPANTTWNGLQCFGCYSSSMESCVANPPSVDCVGLQNRCMDGKGQQRLLPIGKDMVLKGCATANLCTLGVDLQTFNMLLSNVTCCEDAFCNGDRGSTVTADPAAPSTSHLAATSTSIPAAPSTSNLAATSTSIPAAPSTSIPAANSKSIPVTTSTSTPADSSKSIPAANSTSIPAANSKSTPAATNTSIPATTSASNPAAPSTSIPAATSTWISATTSTSTPAAPSTSTPAANSKSIPATTSTWTPAAPSTSTPAAPSTSNPAAPSTSNPAAPNTSIPAANSKSIPAINNTSIPAESSKSTPAANSTSIPAVTSTLTPANISEMLCEGGQGRDMSIIIVLIVVSVFCITSLMVLVHRWRK